MWGGADVAIAGDARSMDGPNDGSLRRSLGDLLTSLGGRVGTFESADAVLETAGEHRRPGAGSADARHRPSRAAPASGLEDPRDQSAGARRRRDARLRSLRAGVVA